LKRNQNPQDLGNANRDLNQIPQDLENADRDLADAIRLDPSLLAPCYNRAMRALIRRLSNPKLLLSDTALVDIRLVLDGSPAKTRELYTEAATLYALAIQDDFRRRVALSLPAGFGHADLIRQHALRTLPEPPSAARAINCVERAIAEGQKSTAFSRNPFFQWLLEHEPALKKVLLLKPGKPSTPPGAEVITYLVEPDFQLPN
jgi:hypothetical protein